MTNGLELLTTEQMAAADRGAMARGVPSLTLMENAGRAVADEVDNILSRSQARIVVLCGPGNNGGDGFVAARLLAERGHTVSVLLLGEKSKLKGDAASMASRWTGRIDPLTSDSVRQVLQQQGADLVVDALVGAGLTRPLDRELVDAVAPLRQQGATFVAVDIPSGLDGNTGAAPEGADTERVIRAEKTVTFFRRKPGHVLYPGRDLCGDVIVAGIGIPATVLDGDVPASIFANAPPLWMDQFPRSQPAGHKYDRGHVLVLSGATRTGAARLSARGALRAGAGLVTILSPEKALAEHAAQLNAIMLEQFADDKPVAAALADKRRNAIVLGPGAGVGEDTRAAVLEALSSEASVVLDADALTSFSGSPQALFSAVVSRKAPVVATPHEGEFSRLFGHISGSKVDRAREAASRSGMVMLLKGPDTVIAAPDQRAAINENASSNLATAGSGDVLTGFIAALLAQRMPAWEAAAAATWLHGECALRFGPGLIAEDLPELLPGVLGNLLAQTAVPSS